MNNKLIRQYMKSHLYTFNSNHMEDSTTNFIYFLAVIGGLVFVIWISKIIWVLIKAILPAKNFKSRYGENTWAVVTGGSDGIGLGFCQQLANLGFNICMIARNAEKMQKALQRIHNINEDRDIKTKYIIADFSNSNKQGFFSQICKQLSGLDISIIVNNVGISNIGNFHEIAQKRIKDEIYVNILPMVILSHSLIPTLLKRQRRSAIINLSSVAGQYPLPYITIYSATKAFNDFFSQAIQMEYSHKIDVLSLRPMYVQSNLSKKQKSFTVASRNQCAQSALKYLAVDYQTNGYWVHRLLSYITSLMPTPMLRCISQSQSRKVMQQQQQKKVI